MKMKTGLILIVFGLLAGLTACTKSDKSAPAEAQATSTPAAGAPAGEGILTLAADSLRYAKLTTVEAVEADLVAPIESTGRVALNEDKTTRVGAFIDGAVMKVPVRVGDSVRQGQPLAAIHSHDVHEAGANLVQARAGLSQKRMQASFARTSFERAERLYQAKALSRQELDRAQVELDSSQQAVIHAEAELERAKGHLDLLGLSPDKLDYDAPVLVRAPASGIIMERKITAGAGVNPGDHLFTISDLSQVWVLAEVEEKRLPELKVGMPMSISVAAYPDQSFNGRIDRIGEVLNPQTRMIEVRCLVDNRSGKLKPEMYTTTRIAAGNKTKALLIPKSALLDIDGQVAIFVALDQSRYQKRLVRTGRQESELIEILEGVRKGERVVTAGAFLLKSELQKSQME
jgi:membrane fusion protein, heavy metal efflux system